MSLGMLCPCRLAEAILLTVLGCRALLVDRCKGHARTFTGTLALSVCLKG